jgi:hypothetical protein
MRLTLLFTSSAGCTELLFKKIDGITRRIELFKEITGISLKDAMSKCNSEWFYDDWDNLRKARNAFAHGSSEWFITSENSLARIGDGAPVTIFKNLPETIRSIHAEFLDVFMNVNNYVVENNLG